MVHQEIFWEGVDRIELAQDWDTWWAVENTVMNLRDQNAGHFLAIRGTTTFQRRTLFIVVS